MITSQFSEHDSLREHIEAMRGSANDMRCDLLTEARRKEEMSDAIRVALYNASSAAENLMNLLSHCQTVIETFEPQ